MTDVHADHDMHDMHGHGEMHDHSAHSGGGMEHMHHGNFQRLFWICLVLTIPTLVFSTGLQDILGLGGPRFPGSQ